MKTCTSGKDCKNPNGPDLPESEFYGNSKGGLKSRCKECIKFAQYKYDDFYFIEDNKEIIKNLKSTPKISRAGRFYTMIEKGKISRSDFRVIMREVDFK